MDPSDAAHRADKYEERMICKWHRVLSLEETMKRRREHGIDHIPISPPEIRS